jgi:SUKH-3 immunity protein
MNMPETLPTLLKEKLIVAGWFEDRKIDVSDDILKMSKFGWKISEKINDFLEEFSNLNFMPPLALDYTEFDCTYAEDDIKFEKFYFWMKENKKSIFPIGTINGWLLFMDEDGAVYESDNEEGIWKRGESISQSLENLLITGNKLEKYLLY